MDKIIASLIAAALVAGALLFSRSAGAAQSIDPIQQDFIPPSGSVGIRNNNPFNLKFTPSINWRGQVGTDGTFAVFDTPLNGIRAGMKNINTKFVRDGVRTVRGLINILSPKFENPTASFVAFVSRRINVSPEQPLEFNQVIIPLSKAIVTFETGEPNGGYPDALFRDALRAGGL